MIFSEPRVWKKVGRSIIVLDVMIPTTGITLHRLQSVVIHIFAMYCTAVYCTVLPCTVLYCRVLYCTVVSGIHSGISLRRRLLYIFRVEYYSVVRVYCDRGWILRRSVNIETVHRTIAQPMPVQYLDVVDGNVVKVLRIEQNISNGVFRWLSILQTLSCWISPQFFSGTGFPRYSGGIECQQSFENPECLPVSKMTLSVFST